MNPLFADSMTISQWHHQFGMQNQQRLTFMLVSSATMGLGLQNAYDVICGEVLRGGEAGLQGAVSFWRESAFGHSQIRLHLWTRMSSLLHHDYIITSSLHFQYPHLVHILLKAGEQFVVVSVRRELDHRTLRESTCSVLIGLMGEVVSQTSVLIRQIRPECSCVLTSISFMSPIFSSDSLDVTWTLSAKPATRKRLENSQDSINR